MNTKQLFAAAAFAVLGTSAFAVEAEQIAAPAGQLTRAEVQAEFARARATGELAYANESYGGIKQQVFAARGSAIERAASRSRDEVREEARAASRSAALNQNYVGS
ncbi:DUF4148 domain-containing protein [uncultured Piscinibacter sp.]|uniref:DUF4148 domain-containing protein n=1 Tax=uncultured Piscinibacter sp. TaxID=1131835 RepID=UPI002616A8F6|nr:DUF4148 domain-containing protein [uncultured Piscinibacter sp.]